MELYHNSRDTHFRSPRGAAPCRATVRLRLRVSGAKPDAVHLRLWFGKESFLPMHPAAEDASLYEAYVHMPEQPCLLWYDFQVWEGGQFFWYGNAEDQLGGVGAPVWGRARSYPITVYAPDFRAPKWTDRAVFYQIFPDRFYRSKTPPKPPLAFREERLYHESWDEAPALMHDPKTGDFVAHDFFGGTLSGIREKLPYLASLGVTALYLNPIFQARTNHRYDTIDWHTIDPLLGTQEDFGRLCRDAHAMGIRLVLDGVFSHSGEGNPFFLAARQHEDSPYRNWYYFEHWPDMYKSWWGFQTLPEMNKSRPEVISHFLTGENAVVSHWLREGADGWRIDVADELPMAFLRTMRKAVKRAKPDALILGEVWEDASNKVSYGEMRNYALGDTMDGVMNYPLREAAIGFLTGALSAHDFKRRMDSLYENYPEPFARCLLNLMGSHDRARALNVLSGASGETLPRAEQACFRLTPRQRMLGVKRLTLLLMLTVSMPGMPCVYYGDEAGMEGCADPFSRGTFPWGREDGALVSFFQKALKRRREVDALTFGALEIDAPDEDILCIRRVMDGQTAHTLINRSNRARKIPYEGRNIAVAAYGYEAWEA